MRESEVRGDVHGSSPRGDGCGEVNGQDPPSDLPVLRAADKSQGIEEGESPSAEEVAVWEAGQDAWKKTIPAVDDTLGRLATLSTALLGGGLVVARADVLPFWWAVA